MTIEKVQGLIERDNDSFIITHKEMEGLSLYQLLSNLDSLDELDHMLPGDVIILKS